MAQASTPRPTRASPVHWLLFLSVVFLLREGATVLLPIAIAVALMFVLTGPVQRLRTWGIAEPWGAGIVVALLLLVAVLLCLTLASPAAQWMERVPTTVRQLLETIDRVRDAISPPVSYRARHSLPANNPDPLKEKLASEGLLFTRVVIGQFFQFALSAAATVILLYFLLASQTWLLSRTVEGVKKPRSRALLLSGIRQAQREIGLYLGTMSLINMGLGLFTGVALTLVGLPNPVLWGTLVVGLNFVPYLGPALMTGMLLLAGSMTFGASTAMLAPPAVFLVGHAIESNLVTPWVLGYRLRLSPLAVFLSVMLWGWLWGFGGALVATPILLGCRALCRRHKSLKVVCVYLEGRREEAPSLHALLKSRNKARLARLHTRQSPRI